MSAATLALDVALLPPPALAEQAQELNAALLAAEPAGFRLDATHLPHVTLLQLGCRASDLAEAERRTAAVVALFPPLPLRIVAARERPGSAWLVVEPTPQLGRLHDALVAALSPLAGAPLAPDAFDQSGGEEPRPRDLAWVERYLADSAGDRFAPHLSLGPGKPPPLTAPGEHTFRRVALCRLGRHCTCRRVLAEWELVGPSDHLPNSQ